MKVAITGHQNLGDEETVAWVKEALQQVIAEREVQHGFTALAIGADQLFAEILRERGIPYTAILPCREIAKTFQTQTHLENFHRLLKCASAVITLDFIEPTEIAFFETGKNTVDQADLVIAVWNGLPAKGLGGTADVVQYACVYMKQVVHLNPTNKQVMML